MIFEFDNKIEFDSRSEILTIFGCKYSLEVFRVFADRKELGKLFRLVSNADGVICIERVEEDAKDSGKYEGT